MSEVILALLVFWAVICAYLIWVREDPDPHIKPFKALNGKRYHSPVDAIQVNLTVIALDGRRDWYEPEIAAYEKSRGLRI